jgi:hypothetical protein
MTLRDVEFGCAGQHDERVGVVCARSPHLGAGQLPPAIDANAAGLHTGQVGPGLRLAHADREIALAAGDGRQVALPLLFVPVLQQRWSRLAVGDPVRGHRSAGGEEFFDHDEAFDMAESAAPVFAGKRHTQPPPGAEAAAESGVPRGDPRVDPWCPAVFGAVVVDVLPHLRAQAVRVGWQRAERRHQGTRHPLLPNQS